METIAAPTYDELKSRHRAMWASGDYPSMVETFLLPLGPRLVDAAGIQQGQSVLDGGRLQPSNPSTVIDCTGLRPRVIRPGAVPAATLRESAPDLIGDV